MEWRIKLCLTLGATTSNLGCDHQNLDFSILDFFLGLCSASNDVGLSPLGPWDTLLTFKTSQGKGMGNYILSNLGCDNFEPGV